MNKRIFWASLMAAVLVTVNVFSSVVFAAEEEIAPAEEAVEIADDSVEIEAETAEEIGDAEFEEMIDSQDIIMPEDEVGFEEDVTGDGEAKFYAQPKFATKDGYDLYLCYVVDNADHNKIVASFYLVCDIGAYGEYFRYDYTRYSRDEFLSEYEEKTTETMSILYMPVKKADRRDDIEGTPLNEHLIPCLTQAEATAMLSDWKEWKDVPVLKDASGHIGYMTTAGIQYPADNGKAVTDADTSDKKDDDSSSKKDDSSSSGKDDGSSSSKDDGSSSSKDGGSSSSKDDSSSSSKDDSSSSSKDDGSTVVDPTKDPNIGTHKFTAAGREYEIRWSKSVSYNGKKHVAKGMTVKKKQTADVIVEVWREGVKLESGKYKLKFYNNLRATKSKDDTPGYYQITLGKGFKKAEKRAVKSKLFGFDITPAVAVSENIVARKPAKLKNGSLKVKLQYKFPEGTVNLKPSTYDCEYNSNDSTVTIHLYGNIKGKVKVPLSQLQR